jgi:hypothetical protein
VLVPLHHGLAPSRLPAAPRLGGGHPAGGRRALLAVHPLPPRLGRAAAPELRRHRRDVVRRAVGADLDARDGAGALRAVPGAAAGRDREQPGRGVVADAGHRSAGRLPDARAGGAGDGVARRGLGVVHHDERQLGLQLARPRLQVGAAADRASGRDIEQGRGPTGRSPTRAWSGWRRLGGGCG